MLGNPLSANALSGTAASTPNVDAGEWNIVQIATLVLAASVATSDTSAAISQQVATQPQDAIFTPVVNYGGGASSALHTLIDTGDITIRMQFAGDTVPATPAFVVDDSVQLAQIQTDVPVTVPPVWYAQDEFVRMLDEVFWIPPTPWDESRSVVAFTGTDAVPSVVLLNVEEVYGGFKIVAGVGQEWIGQQFQRPSTGGSSVAVGGGSIDVWEEYWAPPLPWIDEVPRTAFSDTDERVPLPNLIGEEVYGGFRVLGAPEDRVVTRFFEPVQGIDNSGYTPPPVHISEDYQLPLPRIEFPETIGLWLDDGMTALSGPPREDYWQQYPQIDTTFAQPVAWSDEQFARVITSLSAIDEHLPPISPQWSSDNVPYTPWVAPDEWVPYVAPVFPGEPDVGYAPPQPFDLPFGSLYLWPNDETVTYVPLHVDEVVGAVYPAPDLWPTPPVQAFYDNDTRWTFVPIQGVEPDYWPQIQIDDSNNTLLWYGETVLGYAPIIVPPEPFPLEPCQPINATTVTATASIASSSPTTRAMGGATVVPLVRIVPDGTECNTHTDDVWYAQGAIYANGRWLAGDGSP